MAAGIVYLQVSARVPLLSCFTSACQPFFPQALTWRFPTAAGIVCLQMSACLPSSCCFHVDVSFTTCFGVSLSPPGPMAAWAGCDHQCERSVPLLLAQVRLSSLLASLKVKDGQLTDLAYVGLALRSNCLFLTR